MPGWNWMRATSGPWCRRRAPGVRKQRKLVRMTGRALVADGVATSATGGAMVPAWATGRVATCRRVRPVVPEGRNPAVMGGKGSTVATMQVVETARAARRSPIR